MLMITRVQAYALARPAEAARDVAGFAALCGLVSLGLALPGLV